MADQPDLKTLLENVEEYVKDESRIVTYDWLSQSLGIHVNLAKDALQKYVDQVHKSSGASLRIIYSLGGYIEKNLKFALTTEENLSKLRSKFDKILYSHVYSIQKSGLDDYESLYNANHEKLKSNIRLCNEFSGITFTNLKQRSARDLDRKFEALQQPIKTIKPEAKGWIKKEPDMEATKPDGGKPEAKDIKKESPDKEHQKENNKPGEKKPLGGKTGISAFFAKQQSKPPVEKKQNEEKEDDKKPTNKRIVREPSSDDADEEKASGDVKRFKLSSTTAEETASKPTVVSKTKTQTKPSKGKPQANKKKSIGQKQRKRIQQVSDSESSDGEGSAEEPERIPSPEVPVAAMVISDDEEIPPTPQRTSSDAKKKGRKLVTKHHMDEDGFIVTSKVLEEVSEPEDENAKSSKEPEAKSVEASKAADPVPKRAPSPAKSKQASIMKFFSRK